MREVNAKVQGRDFGPVVCGAPGCNQRLGFLHSEFPPLIVQLHWESMPRDYNARPNLAPAAIGNASILMEPGWKRGDFDILELTKHAKKQFQAGIPTTYQNRPKPGVVSLKATSDNRTGYHLAPIPARIVCPKCKYPTRNLVDVALCDGLV
jgi:hypothetical protein